MSTEVRLDIGGAASEINRITQAVEELAKAESWTGQLAYQVTLALEEVAMNIINYAFEAGTPASSQVTLKSDKDRLTIVVTDKGKPFNPLTDAPAPDLDAALEDRQIGGLGIHLVQSIMDEARYAREGDTNCLTLVKLKNKGWS